jgi:hypothetical protein
LVALEDGTNIMMPEHVAVQAGLVQPTQGSQQVPLLDGPNVAMAGPTNMPPPTPQDIDRSNGVSEARYLPPQPKVGMAAPPTAQLDATEDVERAGRKAKHISQLRSMLGLE